MTWAEMKIKYPNGGFIDELPIDKYREYIQDCFDAYENENDFATVWWSPYHEDIPDGTKIISRRRAEEDRDQVDLDCMPMWIVEFENGKQMAVYPEELSIRERRMNRCPEKYLV